MQSHHEKLEALSANEDEYKREIEMLRQKLDELNAYYEAEMRVQREKFEETLASEEKHIQKLSKELARLKEHLVEMSDSYNKEAILAEERERELRLKLNEVANVIQEHDTNFEATRYWQKSHWSTIKIWKLWKLWNLNSKEIEAKLERALQTNQELKSDNDKLKDKVKQTEESLNHQIKVAKNLELVLERLQNGKLK